MLFEPTIAAMKARGLLEEIETLHLDRGYDAERVRQLCATEGIDDLVCGRQRRRDHVPGQKMAKLPVPLGLRWTIERTNSWLSNYGQMRRNTDRRPEHRLAQLALVVVFLVTAKLIDWRNRWMPELSPIR